MTFYFLFIMFFSGTPAEGKLKASVIMETAEKGLTPMNEMLVSIGYKSSANIIVGGNVTDSTYSYWNSRKENFSISVENNKVSQVIFDIKEKTYALALLEEFKSFGFKIRENQTTEKRIKEDYQMGKIKFTIKQMGSLYDFNLKFG
ncbi:MAG: hypothetical protein ACOZCO_14995 [Bacteroidota bacterium]